MWEAAGEEFALEALATSDSWDARAGRVFTFPPLSAHRHPWGPFPAEQVLRGQGRERAAGRQRWPCTLLGGLGHLQGQQLGDGGMGQPWAKARLTLCLHGAGGLGAPQCTPYLSSCMHASPDGIQGSG